MATEKAQKMRREEVVEEEEEVLNEADVAPLLPREELCRRLRRLNQPVTLFAETDLQVKDALSVRFVYRPMMLT